MYVFGFVLCSNAFLAHCSEPINIDGCYCSIVLDPNIYACGSIICSDPFFAYYLDQVHMYGHHCFTIVVQVIPTCIYMHVAPLL